MNQLERRLFELEEGPAYQALDAMSEEEQYHYDREIRKIYREMGAIEEALGEKAVDRAGFFQTKSGKAHRASQKREDRRQNRLKKHIRAEFYPQGRFTASEVYASGAGPADQTMYAALDALVASGELEYLGPKNPSRHTEMVYQVKARRNPSRVGAIRSYAIMDDDHSKWGSKKKYANWTTYPTYSYEMFYRANPANGSDPVAALMGQLRERRAYYDAAYRGAAPEFVLADLRREIHEIEQRLEAVIDARRGSHAGHAIGNRRKSARKKSAKARKAGRLLPVPERMKMTPRAHAEGISAIGVPGKWPIGDLPHARLALVYALSPSHKKVRRKVLNAVAANYPEYNWAGWWNKKARGKAGVKSWATYVKGASKRRAAANPKARKNFFWGGKTAAPETDTFTVRYEVWVDRMPRKGSKKFTREGLAAWYHGTLADPKVDGVRVKSASGISMKEIADILGVKQSALNNPKKSKVKYGLKIGRSRPDEMPRNAGPYLPQMYPYGRGGRPATYYK
jgi:hypothetical protein